LSDELSLLVGLNFEGGVCKNAGKGVSVDRDRTRRCETIRGCSKGMYLLEAKLLVCWASVLMT
jgi:hypothetical protein